MESSSDGERNHTILEINKDQIIASMHGKISEHRGLLSTDGGHCSIFRVPKNLIKINDGRKYRPHVVSIGPYHREDRQLKMIEDHKWQYLDSLLSRTKITLECLFSAMVEHENRAREYYSEEILLSSEMFSQMMVLDGCFVIELFRKSANLVPLEPDDPIIPTKNWIIPFLKRDFLLLENQIPFFVLDELFKLTNSPAENQSLPLLALQFFNNATQGPKSPDQKHHDLKSSHLLDVVRSSLIPLGRSETKNTSRIPSVTKLRRSGIKLNRGKAESFLDISFKHGVIQMPHITIDNFMTSFLLNCVAFEQCHRFSTKHFTAYATLLDCLVNTYIDAEYLSDRNIVDNCIGNDAEVERFVNNMGKELAFDIDSCYLAELFYEVDQYYQNSWHVTWASFKSTYFNTPWSFISALAALILLLLTVAQTLYTVYGYYNPS